jgi:hypothetical protein
VCSRRGVRDDAAGPSKGPRIAREPAPDSLTTASSFGLGATPGGYGVVLTPASLFRGHLLGVAATLHERLQALGLGIAAVHLWRNRQCEARGAVPHLRHHPGWWLPPTGVRRTFGAVSGDVERVSVDRALRGCFLSADPPQRRSFGFEPGDSVPTGSGLGSEKTAAGDRALVFALVRNLLPARTRRFAGSSFDGANRDRTGDLLLAKQALSQLSYGPHGLSIYALESRLLQAGAVMNRPPAADPYTVDASSGVRCAAFAR